MAEGPIVLDRPWWARLLGTARVGVVGLLGPPLVVGGGIAVAGGAGIDAAAVVGVGLLLCELLRRGWRAGVVVDDEGWHVRNLVVRVDVPWSDVQVLRLAGTIRHRPGAARLGRRGADDVVLAALDGIGRRRRVAWLARVAPVALAHGVDVWDSTMFARCWRGATRVAVPERSRGTWQVRGAVPPPDQGRWVVGLFVALAGLTGVGALVAAARGEPAGGWLLWAATAAGLAALVGWERGTARRQAVEDGNPVRPTRGDGRRGGSTSS